MSDCDVNCAAPCKKKNVETVYMPQKIDCTNLIGSFIDSQHYDRLVTDDIDVYGPSLDGTMTEENVLIKFRKNVFTQEEQDLCYAGLINAATESQNRGMAEIGRAHV